MRDIRVASVQFQHAPGDKPTNLGKIQSFVEQAAARGVELLAFPEMCVTGYWHVRNLSREEVEGLAEPVPSGPSTARLLTLSARHGMTIGAGLIERAEDSSLYNSYVVAMPEDRKSVVEGKSVDPGVRRIIKNKTPAERFFNHNPANSL